MSFNEKLTVIENQVMQVKREYDLYFKGDARIPPIRLREKVQKALDKLAMEHRGNTQERFRFNALQSRFNAFARLWDRTMLQIEQGTYKPDQFKADLRLGGRGKDSKEAAGTDRSKGGRIQLPPDAKDVERKTRDLFKTFIEMRRVTGESVNLSYDSFKKSIDKNREVLKKKFGEKYEFKIAIEDGKAKVKGSAKK
jgi:hypothetical protein